MIKTYLNVVGMIVFMAACWGFIAPPMISADDTLICLLGAVVFFGAPAVTAAWARLVFKEKNNAGKFQS